MRNIFSTTRVQKGRKISYKHRTTVLSVMDRKIQSYFLHLLVCLWCWWFNYKSIDSFIVLPKTETFDKQFISNNISEILKFQYSASSMQKQIKYLTPIMILFLHFQKLIQCLILLISLCSLTMSKPKQSPQKISSIFYTKNLTRLTNDGSYSLDLIEMRKNNTQMIQANKTMRFQKIKKQISIHLRNKKDYIPGFPENLENKPSQLAYFNQEQTKYQSLMKRLRNHNGYHSHRSHQHNNNNEKPMIRKKQKKQNKDTLMQMRKKSKGGVEKNQSFQQFHRKSFTIKEIKPERKERITKQMPICDPAFGKTYGSYYQIVAVQKKFFNSRYFMNGQAMSLLGGGKYDGLDQRYESRIVRNNLQPKRGNKILYAKYEGDVIEPWKLQDDVHIHDGFG